MSTISKILIAVDSSACALNAAKKGFALAHQLNATVGLIFVVDRSKEAISADLDITASESETVLLKQAEETLTQLAKLYDGQGEVFRFTPEGNPKEEIMVSTSVGPVGSLDGDLNTLCFVIHDLGCDHPSADVKESLLLKRHFYPPFIPVFFFKDITSLCCELRHPGPSADLIQCVSGFRVLPQLDTSFRIVQ